MRISRTEFVRTARIGRTEVGMTVKIERTEVVVTANIERIAQSVGMHTTIMITALQKINDATFATVKAILQWCAKKDTARVTVE